MDQIVRGIVRKGLQTPGPKSLVARRLGQDVLAWFKAQGSGYKTPINPALRRYTDAAASS